MNRVIGGIKKRTGTGELFLLQEVCIALNEIHHADHVTMQASVEAAPATTPPSRHRTKQSRLAPSAVWYEQFG